MILIKKSTFYLFVIGALILYFLIFSLFHKSHKLERFNGTLYNKKLFQNSTDTLSFCEKRNEWFDVNSEIFFRTNTAKYYIDQKKLSIIYLTKLNFTQLLKFSFFIKIEHKKIIKYIYLNETPVYQVRVGFKELVGP